MSKIRVQSNGASKWNIHYSIDGTKLMDDVPDRNSNYDFDRRNNKDGASKWNIQYALDGTKM